MIDKLYDEYGDSIIHGPDFDEYFRENTWGLSSDGVHPNSEGYDGMRQLWAETMYANVYSKATAGANTSVKGDVNGDGVLTIADATLIQKYLANIVSLDSKQLAAADVNQDGTIDVIDVTKIQMSLV